LAVLLIYGPEVAVDAADPNVDHPQVRLAFSVRTFSDVNQVDAMASVRAYAESLARERDIPVAPNPRIIKGVDAIIQEMRSRRVDLVSLPVPEFLAIPPDLIGQPLLGSTITGTLTEEFVLLVHRESKIHTVADLGGRTLIQLTSPRASLAPFWLDALFAEKGLGLPEDVLARITKVAKASHVVLPVFFGQVDACVVTRKVFSLSQELNPQLGTDLRVLETSPPYVTHLTCFHAEIDPLLKAQCVRALEGLSNTVAGPQLMNIFQSDRVVELPPSLLESARELMTRHAALSSPATPEGVRP